MTILTFRLTANCRLDVTVHEGIPGEAGEASATGQVIDHRAVSVLAARARARVLALGPDTGQVRGAIGIHGALGSTSFVRVAYVIRGTGAGTCPVLLFANGVRPAGRWDARGLRRGFDLGYKISHTPS